MREGTEPPEDAASPDEPPPELAAPIEPVAESPTPPSDSGSIVRSIALGVVAFAATIVLLGGLSGLLTRSAGSGAAPPSSPTVSPSLESGAASGSPSTAASIGPVASGDPVLVGAGDIADCALDGDEQTAKQ